MHHLNNTFTHDASANHIPPTQSASTMRSLCPLPSDTAFPSLSRARDCKESAEGVQRECIRSAERVQRECRGSAEEVQRKCRGSAEGVQRGCIRSVYGVCTEFVGSVDLGAVREASLVARVERHCAVLPTPLLPPLLRLCSRLLRAPPV
jgi:hypothetical protein